MSESENTSLLIEEFLGRVRIGDVPDVEAFVAEHPEAEDAGELRDLLVTLLDVERQSFPSVDSNDDLPPPDLVSSGYRLLKKIGAGGMGIVYEALEINLERKVAIKLLRHELLADSGMRELFRLEARLLARFNHPGIVRILGSGQCADNFFYVMELAEGQPLDVLPRRPSERQLLQWATEASDALACAHSHGIVHGDIKPANLLLDRRGHVRICDFGLSFIAQSRPRKGGHTGATLRYLAPELSCDGVKNFVGDQYALCASFVEIASAQPFDRSAERSRLFHSGRLAAVLAQGLEDDPKNRYHSVGELRDDLRRIARHEPVTAGRTSLFVRVGLFCRRYPIHVVTATLLMLCLVTVLHGLVRTRAALKLAERNAETANAALGKVFDEVVGLPPTQENANLLEQLIPHYEQIVANPNIPLTELTGALTQLAQTAMRTGDYPLAERTLRRLLDLGRTSANMCRLAHTLFVQGKRDEATALFREIIDRYSSGKSVEWLDAVWAHLHFIQTNPDCDNSADEQSARRILANHLSGNVASDRALFLYAQLLQASPKVSSDPIPGQPNDPLEILDDLSTRHPNNGRYWQSFVDGATAWLKTASPTNDCPETIESALDKSDIMLWRFLNRPHAVSSALSFKRAYAAWLRDSGVRHRAYRSLASLDVLTRALLNQPSLPEQDQSDLIALSLDEMEARSRHPHRRHGFRYHRSGRLDKIKEFLNLHPLPRKDEFLKRIQDLEIQNAAFGF